MKSKMKMYRVSLSALAEVQQIQWVDAKSEKEARKIALGAYNDCEWNYDALDDDTVEILDCEVL